MWFISSSSLFNSYPCWFVVAVSEWHNISLGDSIRLLRSADCRRVAQNSCRVSICLPVSLLSSYLVRCTLNKTIYDISPARSNCSSRQVVADKKWRSQINFRQASESNALPATTTLLSDHLCPVFTQLLLRSLSLPLSIWFSARDQPGSTCLSCVRLSVRSSVCLCVSLPASQLQTSS